MRPGAAHPGLRNQEAKIGVGDHIDPRRRRPLGLAQVDDVLAPIGAETTCAVIEEQVLGAFQLEAGIRGRDLRLDGDKVGQPHRLPVQLCQLLFQASRIFIQRGACRRFHEDLFGLAHLIFAHDEDAPALVDPRLAAHVHQQAENAPVKILLIAGFAAVKDHQVNQQAAPAPVGVRLQQLFEQVQAAFPFQPQQQDGIIPRNGKCPQPRLPERIGDQDRRVSA